MTFPSRIRGGLTRRRFVTGIGAGGLLVSLPRSSHAFSSKASSGIIPPMPSDRWDLKIGHTRISLDGKTMHAPTAGGTVPGPILRWKQGDTVSINVTNTLNEPTSIHWHGIRTPSNMDGVPGLSFGGIAPGETFTYRFKLHQSGTYWYHSHSGMQEAMGLYGAMVIDPRHPDPNACDRDYVIFLAEWTDVMPHDIVSNLKMQDDYYVFRQRTAASFPKEAREAGSAGAALSGRLAWSKMRMAATDIADVSGAIYTYTLNGHAPDMNWSGLFNPGEKVRLRFINGSTMTFFDVRIPGLEMLVVQADGNDIEPVPVDEFRIGVAETYDVIVQPKDDRAYAIFAQSEDRTGYASGTLAPYEGMIAPLPPMDPRPVRTMVDMGMGNMKPGESMQDMDMSADMSGMKMEGDVAGMDMNHMAMPKMEVDDPGPPPINVENQMRAMMPVDRTGSPGDGLENNARRVLNYKQLRATRPGADLRPPTREIILHLTGNMERYIWGMNGRKFSESGPIRLKLGERVRFTLINDTMMEHPIHLHGLWSELENGQGDYRPYKHTIISQPGSKLSYLVTADTPGMWAYHCHLLYHMDLGMFRTVIVA
ncbi:copper resistance system multicopper oxidase [Gluconobacter sphaericus]|uniref:Copper oxidase n=1 Tax=Gluconobacter sphaericus NBRC 12467 TaxID=1307951 RepID=A0AA37SGV5_9PROT|nr:copper resistance system multicopper oxidase [Gluconobacter sphaericus]MBF0885047.1 copper resistance system multicopper oxidase [Gluconobacter sphaericus]MBS1085817.1 copper resistance system multicopper oxidase [Gluconobacter sphaericus]MBS1099706.1 copper resistance system multicopper oxidase [Gluconobacter sphaericus]GBR51429.1 copper resistance protein CopA [Gluconobacter sphaericus NBRC 12467]GEB41850.1 copper oxidase [Gluconobacter sphaericus NBRC 12467]